MLTEDMLNNSRHNIVNIAFGKCWQNFPNETKMLLFDQFIQNFQVFISKRNILLSLQHMLHYSFVINIGVVKM